MGTASTANSILAFFDSVGESPPVHGYLTAPQSSMLASPLLADMFDGAPGQGSTASPFVSSGSTAPFFGDLDISPTTSSPESLSLGECWKSVQSPTVSSSSPTFHTHPFAAGAASCSPGSAHLDMPLPSSRATRPVGFSTVQKHTCESVISAQGESDHSDSERRTEDEGRSAVSKPVSNASRRPRAGSASGPASRDALHKGVVIGEGSGISRTRSTAPAELEVGMMFDGKYITKAELRRIKNRESSARSYYNRKKRVEALERDLELTKKRASTLLRTELSLRQENALLKQKSLSVLTGHDRLF